MSRPDVNEVDIQPVDLGDELGMRVQLRLAPPPVVIGRPISRERLNEGELHALRKVRDGFLLRESCRRDAPAHFVEFRVCSLETKRANRGLVSRPLGASFGHSGWCHADLLLEHMTPDARLPINQTKVSTIPSYQSGAALTACRIRTPHRRERRLSRTEIAVIVPLPVFLRQQAASLFDRMRATNRDLAEAV